MKNNGTTKVDTKLHVRKQVAGGATGAMLGAAVAGPIGAVIGGTVGTMIGRAAEQGRSLEMPKRSGSRPRRIKVRARASGRTARKSSAHSTHTKKSAASRSKTAPVRKIGSKK